MSQDAARDAAQTRKRVRLRVRALVYNLHFIAGLKPEEKYLHPLVNSFDFRNFEIKLSEVLEDYANDN